MLYKMNTVMWCSHIKTVIFFLLTLYIIIINAKFCYLLL